MSPRFRRTGDRPHRPCAGRGRLPERKAWSPRSPAGRRGHRLELTLRLGARRARIADDAAPSASSNRRGSPRTSGPARAARDAPGAEEPRRPARAAALHRGHRRDRRGARRRDDRARARRCSAARPSTTEAERHWAEPVPLRAGREHPAPRRPIEALEILAEAGGEGWLACRDDGWRCNLWWSSSRDLDAMLIVPEVHAAEIAFIRGRARHGARRRAGRSSRSRSPTTSRSSRPARRGDGRRRSLRCRAGAAS